MTGSVFFGSNEYAVGERDGFASVTVVRTGDTAGAVHVTYATNPSSATSGADYTATHAVAVIAAGETSVTIEIPILDDSLSESTEAFAISIESIDSGTLLFPRNTVVKILDDENPATEPHEPPLVSDYTVSVSNVITGLDQPMSMIWLPGSDEIALIAQKKGQIAVINTHTGEVSDDLLIDLNAEVNSNSDRGLMDIIIHPDFANHPYLYAFYVVDPPGAAGSGGNAGEDGDGNRYAHVVRWELDISGGTPSLVAGSKTVILGAAGQSFNDISGYGNVDSTLLENVGLPSSEIDPSTGSYKRDYIKVDSITHAGGALSFGPDGMLYVAVGDGASFNFVDPRAISVQDVDSLSGKILRIDPITGDGLADNPFADAGDLGANASKVWMYGLRNPFTMTFADDGRLFMSETGWYTYEEVNAGGAGSNFGWPYFEGADYGNLFRAPGYQDLPGAADFYDQVEAGNIVITPAYRSLSHFDEDPGFQVNAIVGASSIYTGSRYPSEFLNDYFFTDIVEGEIYAVDINDRTKLKFITDIGDFGPSQMVQGADGYMYLLDLIGGRVLRLVIDNATPSITSNGSGSSAAVNVAENTTAVTDVNASDPDSVTIVYTIDGGADAAKFEIDAGTGVLSFKNAPDFEAPTDVGANNTYQVIVRASDGNTSDTQTIVVTVTDANENTHAPVITSNGGGASASVSVAENTTAVTTVTATDADAGTTLTYSLIGGADQAKFTINASTGALAFISAPNFEAPTDAGANNVYDVTVRVSDGTRTDTQSIAVTVTNTNEHPPLISSNGGGSTAALNVAENATGVTTVTATDADSAATLTYSLIGGADQAKFAINASTGALTFVSAPNFEAPADSGGDNVYNVTVQVSDGAGGFTDTQAIAVTVTNVNEAPVISSNGGGASAVISILENTTVLTTVASTDPDAGASRTYSINGGADSTKFDINASTGALTFKSAPNFEAPTDAGGNNVYDVTVQVSDGILTDTQAIAVTVTNVNEAPTITSGGGGAAGAVAIVENTTAVTTVTASDVDAGAILTYAISGGSDFAKFDINATTGVLTFKAAPNFEVPTDIGGNNVYDVTVQVSDGTLTDTQSIAVSVTNVNEHTPVITSNGGLGTAAVSVAENTTAVTTVTATDTDAGASLTYSLVGGADQGKFTINASTGALSFIAAPDYEVRGDAGSDNIFNVTVQVSDGIFADTQGLAVTVTNVVETAPTITSDGAGPTAAVNVAENATAVTTVVASQGDSGEAVAYSIIGGADSSKFDINVRTGALTFKTAPDFEAPADSDGNNVYDVEVRVSAGASSDTQIVAVTVTNTNDRAPSITSNGGSATASISLAENGTTVATVGATDPDSLGPLSYSLAGGADQSKFEINTSTGALSFKAPPNFEAPADSGGNNVYDVTVQVSDGSFTDTQIIAVTITNLNDNAPVITSNGGGAVASISLAENDTAPTTVVATDADNLGALTYSLAGGDDESSFDIDPVTGALRFKVAPSFESPSDTNGDNVYDVVVSASDGTLSDTQAIAATVTDANDYAPVITSGDGEVSTSVTVVENAVAVTTVTAIDPDAGTSLTYALVGGDDRSRFAINASTGALTFIAAPDFEAPSDLGKDNVYDVQVQVSDGSLIDTQTIGVAVTNRNEAPHITSNGRAAAATIAVKENASSVTTVTASDPDASSKLTFRIAGGADADKFLLDAGTGALVFVKAANFEMPADASLDNRYEVIVEVSDGSLATRQALSVAVTDVSGEKITGSRKSDTLRAANGGESLVDGGNGNDILLGTEFDDALDGGKGDDKLFSGNGWDILDGGPGKDLLVGGPHGDTFRFSSKFGIVNVDKVKLFSPYYDRIELDTDIFKSLHRGKLKADEFHIGKTAADANNYILYDVGSGALFYDPDGSGSAKKIKFAVLVNKPDTLQDGDFLAI